ncbi:MAG: DoxX family protein [Microthrixaceae bacterium]
MSELPDASAGPVRAGRARTAGRLILGAFLTVAGIGHLSVQREEFQAQVPGWFPVDADLVVLGSGVVEIALGASLIGWRSKRVQVGWITAAFFVVIYPGNIAQYVEGTDAFGLDSDAARLTRLFFQPVLIVWALWSTGAWKAWRDNR